MLECFRIVIGRQRLVAQSGAREAARQSGEGDLVRLELARLQRLGAGRRARVGILHRGPGAAHARLVERCDRSAVRRGGRSGCGSRSRSRADGCRRGARLPVGHRGRLREAGGDGIEAGANGCEGRGGDQDLGRRAHVSGARTEEVTQRPPLYQKASETRRSFPGTKNGPLQRERAASFERKASACRAGGPARYTARAGRGRRRALVHRTSAGRAGADA